MALAAGGIDDHKLWSVHKCHRAVMTAVEMLLPSSAPWVPQNPWVLVEPDSLTSLDSVGSGSFEGCKVVKEASLKRSAGRLVGCATREDRHDRQPLAYSRMIPNQRLHIYRDRPCPACLAVYSLATYYLETSPAERRG